MPQHQQFGGINRLYSQEGYGSIRSAKVAIVGIGGVGSWAAEALARSGAGHLILMDLDDLCVTNINRQVHALTSTTGQSKVKAMASRIHDICPDTKVTALPSFYTEANTESLFSIQPDLIIDAIDAITPKAHLIASCYKRGVKIITCGGAGGRTDPAKIETADLSKTKGDPLLASLRKKLKSDYGFPLGEKAKNLNIPCVFSQEKPVYPTCDGNVSCERDPSLSGRMGCDTGFGSVTHITGTFGFFMASMALDILTQTNRK